MHHDDGSSRSVWAAPGEDPRWVVLHDAHMWRVLGLRGALRAAGVPVPGLVLVDSGGPERRAHDLPDEVRVGVLTADVLRAVEHAHGVRPAPEQVVVAGQSFGGLAAAATVVHHPDLARTAVVQSGSFWWGGEDHDDTGGRLVRQVEALPRGALDGATVLLQAGTDEPGMIDGALRAGRALRSAGARAQVEQWRGGHDYAWWRHGLVVALTTLLSVT